MATNRHDAGMQATNPQHLDAAMKMAQLSFENSRKMIELQLGVARELFEEGLQNMKAVTQTKDANEALQLQTQFAQKSAERMLGVTREIAEITADFQGQIGRAFSTNLQNGPDFAHAMKQMFAGMPLNPAEAMNAMETAFQSARQAYEEIARSALASFGVGSTPPAGKGRSK